MRITLTANLSNSIVISACHYMKEKIKTFQVLLHLNASFQSKLLLLPQVSVYVFVVEKGGDV